MKRLIIFDLDGTLVNAYPAIIKSVNHTLKALDLPIQSPLTIKRAVGHGDKPLIKSFVGKDLTDKALKIYRAHHQKALKSGVYFLDGTKSLLSWCASQGFLLAIASNRPTKFTKIILERLGIRTYFKKVLCADRASRPKPYPDMLLKICRDLKMKPSSVIYVGDMTIDVQCGRKAGMRTIAVATGSNTKNELKQSRPYKIIDHTKQLKQLLKTGELYE